MSEKQNEPCCYGGIAHDCHAGEGCRIVERFKNTPQRKPLTDEEIASIYMNHTDRPMHARWDFARAIEAAHGIKEES